MKKTIDNVLIKDSEKYLENYVAVKDLKPGQEVIAFGKDPLKVYDEAVNKGCKMPLLLYIPGKDEHFIFPVTDKQSLYAKRECPCVF